MIIDGIVLAVLLISAIIAFLRGFIREILTIFGMVGATIAAALGGPILAPIMEGWFTAEEGGRLFGIVPFSFLATSLAYGGIFVVVIFSLSLISHMMAESAKSMGLGPLDRVMGVAFGFVRGVFVLALLYLPFHILLGDETKEGLSEGSKTYAYLEKSADWMQAMIPSDMQDDVNGQARELAETAQKAMQDPVLKSAQGSLTKETEQEEAAEEGGDIKSQEILKKVDALFQQATPPNSEELNQ